MAPPFIYFTPNHTHCASVAIRALIEIPRHDLLTGRPNSLLVEIAELRYAFGTSVAVEGPQFWIFRCCPPPKRLRY